METRVRCPPGPERNEASDALLAPVVLQLNKLLHSGDTGVGHHLPEQRVFLLHQTERRVHLHHLAAENRPQLIWQQ